MKKLLSAFVGAFLACSCLASVGASAIARPVEFAKDGTLEVDGYEELYKVDTYGGYVFMKKSGDNYDFINVSVSPETISVTVGEEDEKVAELISSYIPDYEVGSMETYTDGQKATKYVVKCPEGFKNFRELREELAKIADVKEFQKFAKSAIASGSGYIPGNSPTNYITGVTDEQVESLRKYVEESGIDFTVNVNEKNQFYNECNLVPNYEIDFDEHLKIAVDIAKELGIYIPILFQESASVLPSTDGIDILNSIDGDANEDGKMNIADATAIVQAVGNPDKYGLSAQGLFNADIDINGLTALDALAIQKELIKNN